LQVLGLAAICGLALAAFGAEPMDRSVIGQRLPIGPTITAVSQVGYVLGHTDVVIDGVGFPESGVQIHLGSYLASPSSPHTSRKIAGTLSYDIEPAKVYKVALFRAIDGSRISNEVDYFLLYQLHDVAQGSTVKPGDVVDIQSNQRIGNRGSKVVKFGTQPAQIVSWDPAKSSIGVRVPEGLPLISSQQISIEENGKLISNRITVKVSAVPVIKR
jgi:hypothetical protein